MESRPLDYATPEVREPLVLSARLSLAISIACGPLAYALALLASRNGTEESKEIFGLLALISIPALSLMICIVSLAKLIPKDNRRSIRFTWASLSITIGWIVTLAGMLGLAIANCC